jgi:signal transduction histidine kinase
LSFWIKNIVSTASQNVQIEPGILPIFRLFVGVLWPLLSIAMIPIVRGRDPTPDYPTIFAWFQITFLLVYLWWNRLRDVLRSAYLPIALAVASLMPVVSQTAGAALHMRQGFVGNDALVEPARLYFWLLIPLILISSQYGLRSLLVFTTGTSLLSVTLALPLALLGGPDVLPVAQHAAARWFMFTLSGFVIVRIAHAQRQQRRELTQKNAQLAHYATTLEHLAISRERNRLARELHDTLAHTLSAVAVQLKAINVLIDSDRAAAHASLHQTQELTRAGLHEARRALQALRAQPVEERGLITALKHLSEQVATRAGLQLQLDLPSQLTELSQAVEQHLYRIAEEALTNIERHAHAQRLAVTIKQEPTRLRLVIADDGIGFDPSQVAPNGHYGLHGMRERALLINGTLDINSRPQRGTTIQISVAREGEPG